MKNKYEKFDYEVENFHDDCFGRDIWVNSSKRDNFEFDFLSFGRAGNMRELPCDGASLRDLEA